MIHEQIQDEEGAVARTVETGGGVEHVVDLGPGAAGASVDVVDGTAIVVVGDDQYDLDLPGDAEAFIRNGVLTVTTEDSS